MLPKSIYYNDFGCGVTIQVTKLGRVLAKFFNKWLNLDSQDHITISKVFLNFKNIGFA